MFRSCSTCHEGKRIERYVHNPFEGMDFEIGRIDLPQELDTLFLYDLAEKFEDIDARGCSYLAELKGDDCGGAYRILVCDADGDPITDQTVLDIFKHKETQ